jgi:hypothetical protein
MMRPARALTGITAALATLALGGGADAVIASPPPHLTGRARAARTIQLNETGHLRETSRHNFTLNEEGSASGTAPGTIYVHLTTVSTSRVTAEINIYPHGGSLSGSGAGGYRRAGSVIDFYGTMSIERGSGSYAGVHGSRLSFSGTISEASHDPITVHVNGRVSS